MSSVRQILAVNFNVLYLAQKKFKLFWNFYHVLNLFIPITCVKITILLKCFNHTWKIMLISLYKSFQVINLKIERFYKILTAKVNKFKNFSSIFCSKIVKIKEDFFFHMHTTLSNNVWKFQMIWSTFKNF